jgi:antitoxin component YwqK of YwqJK toxin-antitoxin module
MKKLSLTMLAVFSTLTMSAQTLQAGNNQQLKKIVFDGEQVTLVYNNGKQQTGLDRLRVKAENGVPTGQATVEVKKGKKRTEWFTADGRQMEKAPTTKGFYIERRDGKTVKRVKH